MVARVKITLLFIRIWATAINHYKARVKVKGYIDSVFRCKDQPYSRITVTFTSTFTGSRNLQQTAGATAGTWVSQSEAMLGLRATCTHVVPQSAK